VISLVTPIFNEEPILPQLHQEITAAFDSLPEAWEVVYVDDGSRDGSLAWLLGLQRSDPRVIVVELSRNWGHQPALTAGMAVARGDAVILMDGDLQDPPKLIPEFVSAWKLGADVVIGQRRSRGDSGVRKLIFPMFYRVFGLLADFPVPLNAGVFGLMDRRVVDTLLRLTETNRYLPGLRSWVGFQTKFVYYDRAARAIGNSKQSLASLLKYALDAIFSFSYKPLRITLAMGVIIAIASFLAGLFLIVCRILNIGLFGAPVVYGYTSTLALVLFLAGVQLTSIGILGEYLGRIYDEVKRRPLFVIKKIHGSGEGAASASQ